jgi:TrmH family RNA methyltransferase
MISSIHNSKIQRVRELLAHPQSRKEQKAFVAEGVRLIEEALQSGFYPEELYFSSRLSQRGKELTGKVNSSTTTVEEVDQNLFGRLSDTETTQGILAIFPMIEIAPPENADFLLILDSIRDPGNMGTILRTACAAGVQLIYLSPDCVDIYSPKVLRSAMGAHFHMPMLTRAWDEIKTDILEKLRISNTYLSDVQQGISLWKCDLIEPVALIISNEASGASTQAKNLATASIHIPMPGGFESLNASIAAAILLFEVVRQRSI